MAPDENEFDTPDLEGIALSEISQTEQDKHHVISLMCEIFKNKQNKQMNRYREQIRDFQVRTG